ncbi:MAG: spore protease YyaC [Firmicutes bacterium]|nr:spore protease YyaC [Bacillota bacterium]
MSLELTRRLQSEKTFYRIFYQDPLVSHKIKLALQSLLAQQYRQGQQLVVLCIGTDRSTGDALGPFIGTQLERLALSDIVVLGTLEEPVHAINLEETIASIHKNYVDNFIIAIDACLGQAESIGMIDIGLGPVKPGAGVSKKLPAVGNIYINGIVNVGGFLEYYVLQNTRLNIVIKLAEAIIRGLYLALTEST